MRKIIYVSGTRADFGLMQSTLQKASDDPELDISICVTGMHLSTRFGETAHEIETSGVRICGRIPVDIEETSGASMARAIAAELSGMAGAVRKQAMEIERMVSGGDAQVAFTDHHNYHYRFVQEYSDSPEWHNLPEDARTRILEHAISHQQAQITIAQMVGGQQEQTQAQGSPPAEAAGALGQGAVTPELVA